MYTTCGEGEKENLVKASKQTLCSQEKVLALFGIQKNVVFTVYGFSLISGFTKMLLSPENSLHLNIKSGHMY